MQHLFVQPHRLQSGRGARLDEQVVNASNLYKF